MKCVYRMELERLRFVVQSYLRCRLEKLHCFWMFYASFSADEAAAVMSAAEYDYLCKYKELMVDALQTSVLSHLPAEMRSLPGVGDVDDERQQMRVPKVEAHVVCRILEDIGAVQVEPS